MQVLGATFDGASVNRRLVKLHTSKTVLHKVQNVYATDGRDLLFFFGPTTSIENNQKLLGIKKSQSVGITI